MRFVEGVLEGFQRAGIGERRPDRVRVELVVGDVVGADLLLVGQVVVRRTRDALLLLLPGDGWGHRRGGRQGGCSLANKRASR